MKVNFRKPVYYFGAFDIGKLLEKVGFSEEFTEKITYKIADSNFWTNFFQWIYGIRKERNTIHIDYWDTWNVDITLADIIVPLLKKFKELKHTHALIENDDVPEHLRTNYENGFPENSLERYDWYLDELIWTFSQLTTDADWDAQYYSKNNIDHENLKKHSERIDNGLRLFGKYFRSLWD